MNLHMIKEAQIASTVDKSELAILETIKTALGKTSICDLLEAFKPTPADYDEWLSQIVGIAADEGRSITKAADFNELAFDVIDNDPNFPVFGNAGDEPGQMQQMIVAKLWTDYKAAKHGARIEKVVQRQQEEEELADVIDAMSRPADDESDESDGISDDSCVDGGCDDESSDDLAFDDQPSATNPSDQPDLGASDGDISAETIEAIVRRLLQGGIAPDADASDAGEEGKDSLPKIIRSQQMNVNNMANEEEESTSKQPKNKTTFLQQMLRGPRDNLTQALKDVEADGESAWKAHQIPDNPHPKKSMAHKAWERGMKKAVKGHFGFDEKPAVPAGKQKKK